MPCVPREAVLDYLPEVNKQLVMQYFQKLKEERMQEQQQQQMNNQAMEQVGMLSQEMQEVKKAVEELYSRAEQEQQERDRNDLISQGYEQGMDEANLMQTQLDKSGQLPPELLQEIARMDDEALSKLIQTNPELLDMLGVE
jgi:exonuclease I